MTVYVALTEKKKPVAVFSYVIQACNYFGGIIPKAFFLVPCEMIESSDYLIFVTSTGAEPFFIESDNFENFPIVFDKGEK